MLAFSKFTNFSFIQSPSLWYRVEINDHNGTCSFLCPGTQMMDTNLFNPVTLKITQFLYPDQHFELRKGLFSPILLSFFPLTFFIPWGAGLENKVSVFLGTEIDCSIHNLVIYFCLAKLSTCLTSGLWLNLTDFSMT